MDNLLEQIDNIKSKINDQEYIDLMASLSEAKKLIDNNTRFIVKLLTSVPERLASNEIIMRHSYEERIFLMSREEMNSFVIGEAVSINNDLKLINYQFGKSKNIDIDDDERDFTVEITYIPFIFLGAREIIDE
tara:strand:- start:134 stop:532 length:399 start_codon:yes stop_codon:yes gene_type:complete